MTAMAITANNNSTTGTIIAGVFAFKNKSVSEYEKYKCIISDFLHC